MRKAGSTNNVRIKFSELVKRLSATPDISVAVGKSWVAATEETLNVKFAVEKPATDTPVEAEADEQATPAVRNTPKFEV